MADAPTGRQDRHHGHGGGHGHGHHDRHHDEEKLPVEVEKFLIRLKDALVTKQLDVLSEMYEIELPALTEAHYTVAVQNPKNYRAKSNTVQRPWPAPQAVKGLFKDQQVEQVYQLHYARSHQNQWFKVVSRSWDFHGDAFKTFVSSEARVDLPNAWIWDVVDEFVYQLGQSRNFRRKTDPAQQQQQQPQQPQPQVAGWSVLESIARLEEVVEKSNIKALLEDVAKGKVDHAAVIAPGEGHLRRVLGYSAMVGIVKVRVLLGDYHGALEAAEPLLLRAQGGLISVKIPPLHAALFFHVGFAFFMLRRYADSIAMLQNVMNVRSQRKYFDSLQGPVVRLIMMAGLLGDTPAPDYSALVSERYKVQDDDQILLAQGDLDRYREVFFKCAPKFFSAAEFTHPTNETGHETKELQVAVFLRTVSQQLDSLKLRGYLTTYSTLTTQKVASLLNRDSTQSVEAHLVCMKRNTRQRIRAEGKRLSEGVVKRVSTVDFTAENGTIAVQKNTELPTVAAAFFDRLVALKKPATADGPK